MRNWDDFQQKVDHIPLQGRLKYIEQGFSPKKKKKKEKS